MHAALPHLSAPVGGYALLGMGGMMAGVTRAPLLAVIMIFELTQNTAVLLPMMVVSVVAVAAAKVLQKDSMYVASLRSAGIVWESTPEATALASLKVSDIMRRDVALVPRTTPLPEIVARFLSSRSLFLYIGDEEGRLLGVVDIHDIKESFPERELSGLVIAADLVTEIPFATPDEPLTSVNEKLWFRDVGQLPVVESDASRKFLGVVTQRDLLAAFDSEVLRRNRLVTPVRTFGEEGGRGGLPGAAGEAPPRRARDPGGPGGKDDGRGGPARALRRFRPRGQAHGARRLRAPLRAGAAGPVRVGRRGRGAR